MTDDGCLPRDRGGLYPLSVAIYDNLKRTLMRQVIKDALDECWSLFVEGKMDESDAKLSEAIAMAESEEERLEVGQYVHNHILTRRKAKRSDVDVCALLSEVKDFVRLAPLAERYFGKGGAWLSQRINGNLVNGKPASFTSSELQNLSAALADVGIHLISASRAIKNSI